MKLFLLPFLLFLSLQTFAQNTRLKVQILAEELPEGTGRGLVYSSADSSLVKGNYIDSNWLIVRFNAKIGDEMYLRVTAPGYSDSIVPFTVSDTLIELDPIRLLDDLTLDAVNVVYEKPVFERTMNGLSVNVKGTTLEELNTLFDVLKASPKLSSPDDETIEIIGRGVPLILIDRQPILSVEELKAIPASEVDKINIMTNPSAKYKAQGSGNGVIEVFTNNFTLQGYRANVRADGGVNTQLRPQAGLSMGLNIKKNKFSLNGYFGGNWSQSNSFGNSSLETEDNSVARYSDNTGDNENFWRYYKLKMGYDISEDQRLTFGVGGHGSSSNNANEYTMSYYRNDTLTTDKTGTSDYAAKWLNNNAFANYTWDTDTLGSFMEVNLNYTRRVSDSDNEFKSHFLDYSSQLEEDYHTRTTSTDRPHVGELRFNYEHHFDTTECKLELGGEFSGLLNKKRFNREIYEGDVWVEDTLFSNSYDYKEYIGGLFAQFSKMFDKVGFQIGLRGEYTRLDGYSRSLEKQFMDSSFILPFPNAGILFEPSEKVAITAYYESGIDRPSFNNYDPFIRRLDSLNMSFGNPYLRPSYNHTVGLELDLFYSYNIGISYSRYNNFAGTLTFIDEETYVTSSTPWNADYNETYSFSVSIPIDLEWLDGWNSFWLDYDNYVFTDIFQRDPYAVISFGFHSYLTFKLPHDFNIMNRFFMNKWGNDGGTSNVNRNWSIRVTKEFDKPDLNIFAEVNNIFPNRNLYNSVNGNYISSSDMQYRFTGFRVGIFWKFGRLTASTNIKESESGQSGRF